jgi:hypothetical protein
VFAATVIACSFAIAQPPGSLPAAETDALSKNVRTLVLLNLPDPIVQSSPGWGTMKETTVGVKYHRDGLKLWTEVLKGQKPDGTWRRIAVKAVNPQQTLALALKDVVSPEPGKLTFTAFIGVDCEIKFEQQLWNKGNRLYSGETRGRCHGALLLKCEATNRVEPKPGSFIPDLVLRRRGHRHHPPGDAVAGKGPARESERRHREGGRHEGTARRVEQADGRQSADDYEEEVSQLRSV